MSKIREQALRIVLPHGGGVVRGWQLTRETGPVGVFVHGFRANCDGEKARGLVAHAVRRGYGWIRFDQRGRGRSDGDFHDFTVSRGLTDLHAVLDTVAERPVVLVGSSLGGLLALHAARARRSQVRGLLLIAPALQFVARHFDVLPTAELEAWRRSDSREFVDLYEGGSYTLGYEFYSDAQHYRANGPSPLDCPVEILHGERDEVVPAADSLEFAASLQAPRIRTEIVPRGDHRLNHVIPLLCRRLDALWPKA